MKNRSFSFITSYFFVLLLLLSTLAYSGDQAYFELTGFSASGQYLSWETGGIQDGSGFQWASLEILNTQTSMQEENFEYVWDEYIDEFPSETDMLNFEKEKENICNAWGIDLNEVYEPLVFYPLTDLGVNRDTVTFCLEKYVPDYHSGEITLTLLNKPADIEQSYPEWFPPPVTPVLQIKVNEEESVFFQENTVPEECSFSMSYGIYAIYRNPILPENLIVVLGTTEPGFEGPNGRFRVVSGSI